MVEREAVARVVAREAVATEAAAAAKRVERVEKR